MQTPRGIGIAFEPIFSGLALVFELLAEEYLFGIHMDFVPLFILLSDGALKRLHLSGLRQVDIV